MMREYIEESVRVSKVTDPLSVGYYFKRMVSRFTSRKEISTTIGIVCSELTSNIVKYADSGYIRCRIVFDEQGKEAEIVAEDDGPGIENLDMALKDGFTDEGPIVTERTVLDRARMACGLPAVKRMMDHFEIQSEKGKGTTVTARKRL
jgi:serine/threonine-protein kinase RsbT